MSTSYDTGTGLPTTLSAGGKTLTTGYDSLGRASAYTDATGNVSATTYCVGGNDLRTRPASPGTASPNPSATA